MRYLLTIYKNRVNFEKWHVHNAQQTFHSHNKSMDLIVIHSFSELSIASLQTYPVRSWKHVCNKNYIISTNKVFIIVQTQQHNL